MNWHNRITALSVGLVLLTWVADAHVAGGVYRIESTDALNPHFVQGETVQIRALGPSAELAVSSIKLNGKSVKVALKRGDSGVMTASITGLKPGDNLLQLVPRGSQVSAADLQITRGLQPKMQCSALAGRAIAASEIGLPTKGAKIDSATLQPATPPTVSPADSVPEVCYVRGSIFPVDSTTPNIIFAVAIPALWNQKAIQIGGNGRDGFVPLLTVIARDSGGSPMGALIPPDSPFPIAQGYATYGDDSGHGDGLGNPPGTAATGGRGRVSTDIPQDFSWYKNLEPWFLKPAAGGAGQDWSWYSNDGAWENFVGAHIKKTHDVAMNILVQMFGTKPRFNYFAGESNGGKEAMMAATRFGEDYDGIQASVPLLYWSGRIVAGVMFARSQYDASSWVTPSKAQAVAKETLRVCDSLDGVEDGVISNYMGCYRRMDQATTKDPLAGIRCPGGADTGNECLSDPQMAVVNSIRASTPFGFPMANGETDWPGMPAGIEDRGWILWQTKPTPETAIQNGVNRILVERAKGKYDVATQSLTELRPLIQTMSDQLDPKTDWSALMKHGGKLILHTAGEDYTSNDRTAMRYYEAVVKRHGQQAVDSMARFYVTPNGNHGSTGYSAKTGDMLPHYVNLLSLLEDWVENGVTPPDAPIETLKDKKPPYSVISSRPLCRFPKYPRYKGSGDLKQADSYVCTNP